MKRNDNEINKLTFLKNLPWLLWSLGLFVVVMIVPLIQQKLPADGLLYVSIAWNMAQGIGSLWHPSFTQNLFLHFYEHPSLSFYSHSLLFRLLGDHFIVDRLYCLLTELLSLWAMILVWHELQPTLSRQLIWLPIFCWVAVPLMARAYTGNNIEDLLVVFTTFSVWGILRASKHKKSHVMWLLFSSICITAAFFTNGLQAFFPLIVPVLYQLVFRKHAWKMVCFQTFLLWFFTAGLLALVLSYHPAYDFIQHYFQNQVLATLSGARLGNGDYQGIAHLYGILLVLVNFLPLFFVMSIVFYCVKKARNNYFSLAAEKLATKDNVFLLLVGLSASLPVLASTRQMMHYFLQAFPFFILCCVMALAPIIKNWIALIHIRATYYKVLLALSSIFFVISCVITADLYGRPSAVLIEVNAVNTVVPNGATVSVSPTLWNDWSLHAYFYRYHKIDLTQNRGEQYYMQKKTDKTHPTGYEKIDLPLQRDVLYRKCITRHC